MNVLMRSVDAETTALKLPEAEVIEWGWADIQFDTDTKACVISKPSSILFAPSTGIVPPESCAVHHLQIKHLRGHPVHTDADAKLLVSSESPQFIVAHNFMGMEAQWLTPQIMGATKPICTMKCAARIWPEAPSMGNSALRYWLDLELDERLADPAHRAGPDAYVTAHLLARMLKTETVNDLVRWTREPRFYATVPLGKHRGSKWEDCPGDYLAWLVRTEDMEPDVRHAARTEIERRQGVHT